MIYRSNLCMTLVLIPTWAVIIEGNKHEKPFKFVLSHRQWCVCEIANNN